MQYPHNVKHESAPTFSGVKSEKSQRLVEKAPLARVTSSAENQLLQIHLLSTNYIIINFLVCNHSNNNYYCYYLLLLLLLLIIVIVALGCFLQSVR